MSRRNTTKPWGQRDVVLSKYYSRDNVIKAISATKKSPFYSQKRNNDVNWYESYNNAIALYRYVLRKDDYNYDLIVGGNGTIYDEIIDSFKESDLIFDSSYSSEGFNAGRTHAIRIIKLKNREIKLEYLGDYEESSIISDFENYLHSSSKSVRR